MTTVRPALAAAARAAIAARTAAVFRSSGALTDGHFRLKSGRHSERYLEKFLVLQDPAATGELCGFWAARYRDVDGAAFDAGDATCPGCAERIPLRVPGSSGTGSGHA